MHRITKKLTTKFVTLASILLSYSAAYAEPSSEYLTGVRDSALVEQIRELDRQTQIIKERSLDVFHSAHALERSLKNDQRPLLRVFFSTHSKTPVDFKEISIDIDGEKHLTTFNNDQSGTLNDHGKYYSSLRTLDLPVSAGELVVTATVDASFEQDLKRSTIKQTVTAAVNHGIDRPITHLEIRLTGDKKNRFEISFAEVNAPQTIGQLYINEARYLTGSGESAKAITRLQTAVENGFLDASIDAAEIQLATSAASYGVHYLSSALYQKLVDRERPVRVLAKYWQQLAKLQFANGYFGLTGLVEYSLSRIDSNTRNRKTTGEKDLLLAQLYIAQKRYADAVEILTDWRGEEHLEPYVEYNLGVSLININEIEKGTATLDKLGKIRGSEDELSALRDLANLSLAYYFLDKEQAGTALPLLKRIRTEGAFSNKALLALGWAELGESGQVHKNSELIKEGCRNNAASVLSGLGGAADAINNRCTKETAFKREKTADKKKERLERALVPWLAARKRNPIDPAVQETLLAIPFAIHRLRKLDLAIQHYRYALKVFDAEIKRNEDALSTISRGNLLNPIESVKLADLSRWRIADLEHDKAVDLRLLYQLAARHEFYQGLYNYRSLLKLADNLAAEQQNINNNRNAWYSAGGNSYFTAEHLRQPQNTRGIRWTGTSAINTEDTVYGITSKLSEKAALIETQARSAAEKHRKYLEELAEEEITARRDRLIVYSARARLAMARIYDKLTAKEQTPELYEEAK